jgi:glyoxylase-like metal-dependent hydrolase (beta-lactamase superfamily II)
MTMKRIAAAALAAAALISAPAFAQSAANIVADATRAMGVDTFDSLLFYGSGANYTLGQNNNAEGPLPRTNLNDYRRFIDFRAPSSLASAQTFAVPVTGGPAAVGQFRQNITPANSAWAQQLEIWTTPWGFLKGAAANDATVQSRSLDGQHYYVVTWNTPQRAPSGIPYTVVGYINQDTHLVDRVETWVENPIFGDLHVESIYTDYRDVYGVMYPTTMVQNRAGWSTFEAHILGAHANPEGLPQSLFPSPPPQAAGPGPGAGGGAGGPPPHQAEQLADGVYRITGGYVALAVEFNDHILVYEPAGQNEQRAESLLETVKRTIPNKPIRYAVLSHHHFDHTGGLPAVVAEGAIIVTHDVNVAFFERALNAPRTLAPDAITRSGRRPMIEGMGEFRVFTDGVQTVELHLIQGLPHADGMLVAYLPAHGIVAYADMFNPPPANDPVPDPPVVGTMIFADNLERLNLDWSRLITVHPPTPDRPLGREDVLRSLGRIN